jgi:uncharacterized membrane protein
MNRSRGFPEFVLLATLLQFLTNIVVQLDVPYLRQVFGFIYLTFVPGFVILRTFKLAKGEFHETILFSIGLSIALLMFVGLFINELFHVLGLASPLSTLPLLVTLNFVVILPCLWACLKGTNAAMNKIALSYHSPLIIIIPFLGVAGALAVNNFGNNFLLLLMLAIVAGLVALGIVYKKILPAKLYPLAILAISVALLFHSSLITHYLVGYDIHSEYHVFKLTESTAFWNSTFSSWDDRIATGNSMLSITILPSIYSMIANVDGTWLLKILYPLLLSFVPLALYKIYSKRMKKEVAFLSAFFAMSSLTFFGTEGFPAKQMIGEFFYVLLFLVILKEKMSALKRNFFFVVFSAGLVVSHYSMSYIFLFLILLTWLLPTATRFFTHRRQRNIRITLSTVLIFFTITFAWYIYTSASAPFNAITNPLERISRDFFADFYNPSARTTTVLRGLGAGQTTSLGHQTGRIFFYIAEFFIVVGIANMLFRKEHTSFGQEYVMLSVLNFVILLMCIIIPNFARFLRMERFYQISLLFLAPFFVLGGKTVFEFISRRRNQTRALNLVLVVLIPFFLFETSFIYELTRDFSSSLSLSMYRMDRDKLYDSITDEREVVAALWLSSQLNSAQHARVYGDIISDYHVLTSYGMMSAESFDELTNTTQFTSGANYVYLRGVNTIEGIMRREGYWWNLSDINPILDNQNIIYSNKNSEIFYVVSEIG